MIDRLNAALEGRYRIDRQLGEGGMATVFLAQDLRHDRLVALKVLKPELAAVVGGDRFLAEIKTTANLQHPHILPLYDSGEADSFLFYVMPYVEGESLREKLDRERQLPLDEAVRIARAVAGGLDYAHRQGVVHRDIKPDNILLQDGEPVIADFGIALAIQQAGGGRLTETGLSLGTPYYMSPEQATADRDPDARSDVYSLASVLYEMLTGEPPFQGTTAQSVLGKILTAEPVAPTRLRSTIPPGVDAATLRGLAKLPADRYASAAEFARALDEPASAVPRAGGSEPDAGRRGDGPRPGGLPAWLPWAVAGIALVALVLVLSVSRDPEARPRAETIRATLELPENMALFGARLTVSDDGSMVAVTGTRDGRGVILARRLDSEGFFAVEGTEGGDQHFLSADGRTLIFRAAGQLRQIPVEGGQPVTLDPQGSWAGGDWLDDGSIVYGQSYRSGLWRLPPGQRAPEQITEPVDGELAHWWPDVLPGGRHILFTAFRTPIEAARLSVVSVDGRERIDVLDGAVHGRYVPTGHIVFARGEALYAVPFDLDALKVTGDPVRVVDDVAMEHPSGLAAYDISDSGTLFYVPASDLNAPSDLVWVNRDGTEEPVLGGSGRYSNPAISPDGRTVAVAISTAGQAVDVWTLDLVRGTRSRIAADGGADFAPVWTPGGARIIYSSEQPVFDLYWRPADGSAPAAPFVEGEFDKYGGTFDPEGESFYYAQSADSWSLWRAPLDGSGPAEMHYGPAFNVYYPEISPDGRWLAYASDESGEEQVYISSFPDPSHFRRQASAEGGRTPRWTRGGRELVYVQAGRVMSVSVDPETGDLGPPELLFEGPYLPPEIQTTRNFDVTPDGRRFLMVKRPAERAPRRVIVVTNFFDRLRALNAGGVR